MKGKEFTIIPDVHGRPFWRSAVQQASPEGRIIFLGDYLDPYPWEGITPGDATSMLREIITLKKESPDDVVLLLGNHDMGYLDPDINFCRRDHLGASRNRELLEDNLDLFSITHTEEIGSTKLLFSHAGIGVAWLARHRDVLGEDRFDPDILNDMLHDDAKRRILYGMLAEASFIRGGDVDTGSPVWADVSEYAEGEPLVPGYLHLFGHSLNESGPVRAGQTGFCLDCMRAFTITEDPFSIRMLP